MDYFSSQAVSGTLLSTLLTEFEEDVIHFSEEFFPFLVAGVAKLDFANPNSNDRMAAFIRDPTDKMFHKN